MKKIIFLLLAISIIACKEQKKGGDGSTENTKNDSIKVTLHVLEGGTVIANKLELFSEDTTYTGQSKQFADAYYVIQHPKGNLMWDAGLPESLVGMAEPFTDPSGAFTVSRKDSLKNQLKAIGLTVDDFKYIALSHSHFDHVGHANALKNTTWLVQENEYDFFTSDSAKTKQADIYKAIKDLNNVQKLNGDYDVFGDSTVVIKSMPGHTIGHQVLYLDLALERPVLLTGDLYHFEENRTHKRVPMFNYDIPLTKKSIEAFESFAAEKNADVFIQHSQKDFERLKSLLNN
ncbi:N-acyl homoserine lactonase family protein [Aureibaculum sp. 2210JD6-5]|uniref:N-acyl homoserine lactonase family protein n=1 Tax=Aureibaculum sp. 2210JD6-5 TaxID=3103957 RepID=UPI002AADE250|nr:N-acyl homoserine lactonase family protein [Aureibaculum sp. 2210JD6-5]MDY7395977.1 N-acyl homoserine lactonase family protein [Aureibaculum sp. 2210JD6-5]